MDLKPFIRDIPDFPRAGILFKDITPLLSSPVAFQASIGMMEECARGFATDVIIGVESRGFLFATPLALRLGKPFVPVRKLGKLPYVTHKVTYGLEYGSDTVEVHVDAISPGQRVLLVDDLLATGGTTEAAGKLVENAGGVVAGVLVLIELVGLRGRERLQGYDVTSLVKF